LPADFADDRRLAPANNQRKSVRSAGENLLPADFADDRKLAPANNPRKSVRSAGHKKTTKVTTPQTAEKYWYADSGFLYANENSLVDFGVPLKHLNIR
jgi:hypothetical protein